GISERRLPRHVGSDEAPRDRGGTGPDADRRAAVDRHSLQGPSDEKQAGLERRKQASIDFDQRRAGVTRLRGAVDRHDEYFRQLRQGSNLLDPGPDREVDRVSETDAGVQDRLT